ncbi:AAA+-type ATPase, SpoVK/Ycf46/Vps4 family [Butyrivibrio sp. Su6]|uniref:ATP-binding protein n=1 Tax=Butyrivibrio sp. Su6 TaxID=1520810 RepID=UPI00089ECABF|nr:AAA family ATPase [Butyrivibrio sp. Su6]SEF38989.1 AAA+-type ATPase, SpoVK/Ycf46/Vps4 family [Butyrivibrio sp. Su6]
MEQKTDDWRGFVLDLISFANGGFDNRKNTDSLRTCFDGLYEKDKDLGLSEISFFALIFYVCKDLYESVDNSLSKKSLSYRDICLYAGFIFPESSFECELLSENSLLNEVFMEPLRESEGLSLSAPMKLESGIESFICEKKLPLGEAELCCKEESYEELLSLDLEMLSHKEEILEAWSVVQTLGIRQKKGIILFEGTKGRGKRFAARRLSCQMKKGLLTLSLKKYLAQKEQMRQKILKRVLQKVYLENYQIYIDCNGESLDDQGVLRTLTQIISYIQLRADILVAGCEKKPGGSISDLEVYEITLQGLNETEQIAMYKYFSQREDIYFADDVDFDKITSKYRLNSGQIKEVLVNCAKDVIGKNDSETDFEEEFIVDRQVLEKNIRSSCNVSFNGLATRLESAYTFEDIALPDESLNKLKEVIDRVIYKNTVLDKYGFSKKLPYGRGLVLALYGPPGTGKTMAANVLANELGLDIYRIDLSQISSKYVGESEKNLGAVFEAAKDSNVVLFFDEADALFAKRTEVSSSNDKYSNSETAYLLQKMEEYEGISILATNVMQNFDNAFKRRITYIISIEAPQEKDRLLMWKKVFPKEVKLSKDVKFEVYARYADMPGSSIKSAALSAAYKAAAGDGVIKHEDLCSAIDEEYKKTGHTSILRELLYGTL